MGELPEKEWLRALKLCPRELVELVNSKACRGQSGSMRPLLSVLIDDLLLSIYRCHHV